MNANAPKNHVWVDVDAFRLRPLALDADLSLVHSWVSQPYAKFWGLVGCSTAEVRATYVGILQRAEVFLAFRGEVPAFLLEVYDPARDEIGQHYDVQTGDLGMHVLFAPCTKPESGFGAVVFRAVLSFLFREATVRRIVVEPDIRNEKIHVRNREVGFRYGRPVQLPHKVAHLAFCTRDDFAAAMHGDARRPVPASALERCEHLEPRVFAAAQRALVRKMISELCHERMLKARCIEPGELGLYELTGDAASGVTYRFRASVLALEHWEIDAESIAKQHAGQPAELDALKFTLEFREQLALSEDVLPVYLEELASTLSANAYKRTYERCSAGDLVHADYQAIEAAMTEGHPAFIANSGRIGFDLADYAAFAPEAAAEIQVGWLAARRTHARSSQAHDVDYDALVQDQLGERAFADFRTRLHGLGLDPDAYVFLPVHPWQWRNKLALAFAPDLASRDLVWLGYGPDLYRAQQSIRTLFNVSRPEQPYVKGALSVLNMGFMRGLSPDYMECTPAICDWVEAKLSRDPYFAAHGFRTLREFASIGFRSARFEQLPKGSPYRKMLAALFRESPLPMLRAGQRVMTMAALLHRDRSGLALLPQLILASGLTTDVWLERYLNVYLAPLVHCLLAHDLAFMPHGENLILVLERHAPVRAFMKDVAEEVVSFDSPDHVPPEVRRICAAVPEELRTLSIFTDVFDGFFRYLAAILRDDGYAEAKFWAQVAACIQRHRDEHPGLAEKAARFDLFATRFRHSCLNRLQLRNNRQMVDLANPASALQFAGELDNPIAGLGRPESPSRA